MTAVECLYKFLYEMESFAGFDPYDFKQEDVFNKAKEMEKQQIMSAFDFGVYDGGGIIKKYKMSGEQYYNETFKPE